MVELCKCKNSFCTVLTSLSLWACFAGMFSPCPQMQGEKESIKGYIFRCQGRNITPDTVHLLQQEKHLFNLLRAEHHQQYSKATRVFKNIAVLFTNTKILDYHEFKRLGMERGRRGRGLNLLRCPLTRSEHEPP